MMDDSIETFLMENEAVNQLLLANTYMKRKVKGGEDSFFGKVVYELGDCELIFFSMAPYNLLVQMMRKEVNLNSVEVLVDYLINHNFIIMGINANHQICQIFMKRYV